MTATLTKDTISLNPLLVLGYSSSRRTGNIVHTIIGRSAPDITYSPATLRTGSLSFLVSNQAAALALEALHVSSGSIRYTDTDAPAVGMVYVSSGDVRVELDSATRMRWTVTVDFQEVA